MKTKAKTIYFKDEVNEDFANIKRDTICVDSNFKYTKHNPLWKCMAFVVYRLIMKPFAYVYCKIKFRQKTVNKSKLKPFKKSGYFIYGNHTLMAGDAFIPNIVQYSKRIDMIVHADNISQKGLKNFVLMNGAIPIPTKMNGMKNFLDAIKTRVDKGSAIMVYPEAHVWPYYTKIRPYSSTAFRYPVKFDKPVFCLTNTFKKTRFRKTPKVITYIDGPFYLDATLDTKSQEQQLKNSVYSCMVERAKSSDYEFVKYVKLNPNEKSPIK